jgi:hypothetical protein
MHAELHWVSAAHGSGSTPPRAKAALVPGLPLPRRRQPWEHACPNALLPRSTPNALYGLHMCAVVGALSG